MNGQPRNELRRIMSKDQGYDAHAHNTLADVAAARDKGEPVVVERSGPNESAAMPRKIDTELRATDAGRPAHQPAWNHCQQERAAGMFGSGAKRTENAGTHNHASSHKRRRGASELARHG